MKTVITLLFWLRFDALWLGGIAALGYGCYEVYPPSAFIVVGIVLTIIGITRSGEDGPTFDEDPEVDGDEVV